MRGGVGPAGGGALRAATRPRGRAPRWCAAAAFLLASLAAAPALADFESARKFFLENVKDPDWKARRNAYGALQDHDGRPAAQLILQHLASETNPAVQASALDVLGAMRSQDARTEVLDEYRKGKPSERLQAAAVLASLKGADVDGALIETLKAGPPILAAQAALALGQPGRASASGPLIAALAHDAWQVRVGAARALGALRDRAALAPLVERLRVEKGRARAEAVAALESISGQRIGDAPKRWAAVVAGTDPTAVAETPALPPTFFGAPVTGERVVFVLDRSLNMRDEHPFLGPENRERLEALCTPPDGARIPWRTLKTKQQLALAHLKHAVDGLPKGTSLEVVHFAEDVKGAFGLKLTSVGSTTRKSLYEVLGALEVDDGINLFGALDAALDVGGATDEKAFKSGPDQVLLVTNNVPTKGEVTEAAGVLAAIALKARLRMVAVSTVGIGNHPFDLAEGLAKRTGGVYVNLTK